MPTMTTSPRTFNLESIDFVTTGFYEDEAPAYLPSPIDEAWRLGFELEEAGEAAKLPRMSGHSQDEYQAFCNGARAARASKATVPAIPVRMTPAELAEALRTMAAWCDGQGGQLGAMASHLLRQGAKDVSYFAATTPEEFDAREAEMIRTLESCPTCERNAYMDRM